MVLPFFSQTELLKLNEQQHKPSCLNATALGLYTQISNLTIYADIQTLLNVATRRRLLSMSEQSAERQTENLK